MPQPPRRPPDRQSTRALPGRRAAAPPPLPDQAGEVSDEPTSYAVVAVALALLLLLLLLMMAMMAGGGGSDLGAGRGEGGGVGDQTGQGNGESDGDDDAAAAGGEETGDMDGDSGAPAATAVAESALADQGQETESLNPSVQENASEAVTTENAAGLRSVAESESSTTPIKTQETGDASTVADSGAADDAPVEEEADEPEIDSTTVFILPGASRQEERPVSRVLSGRTPTNRRKLVRQGGGSRESERAVDMALKWFSEHQKADGGWDFVHNTAPCDGSCRNPGSLSDGRIGATAMALLPFLGAGETHRTGKYKECVSRGLEYLRNELAEAPTEGCLADGGKMYSHGLATIAFTEAYAMTQDESLRAPAQAAVSYIVSAQDPRGGGWRYDPRQPGDTSVVGWQVIALKSGQLAYLEVPDTVLDGATRFLDSVQQGEGEHYGYVGPGARPSTSAIGLLCRRYLSWSPRHPSMRRGVAEVSRWGPSPTDLYYDYYATQLMFQHTKGKGGEWKKWNTTLRNYLVENQSRAGHETGSWQINDPHGGSGGRLYCTSLATLILEVYYRHMPVFK